MARPLEPKGPNAGQIRFWNEAGIAYYFCTRDAIRAKHAPLTRRLIKKAAVASTVWISVAASAF